MIQHKIAMIPPDGLYKPSGGNFLYALCTGEIKPALILILSLSIARLDSC